MEQNLTELKREINNSIVMIKDFNIPFSAIDRIS